MDKKELKELYAVMKTMSILYVEDDLDASEQMMDYLSELFEEVHHARNAVEGLLLFKNNKIDFIITDIIMTEMNGFEMLREIEEITPNIPIFIITANKEHEYYEKSTDYNVKVFLSKPFSLNKLVELFIQTVQEIHVKNKRIERLQYLRSVNNKLLDIGNKISTEKDMNLILEYVLKASIDLSQSDGGTLYLYNKANNSLDFKIAINESLNINYNGFKTTEEFNIKSLSFNNSDNTLNRDNISIISAYEKRLINLDNIYEYDDYNFHGIKKFDIDNDYQTESMLVVPLVNVEDELFGVIQLINKTQNNEAVSFTDDDEFLLTSLCAIVTMTLDKDKLD